MARSSHGYSGGNWTSHNFYHADGNGNVTALASGGGCLQASYLYDPYGRYLSGGGVLAGANTMRFSRKPWIAFADLATEGLYYYGYRFYDPYLQRWTTRDPLGDMGSIVNRNLIRANGVRGIVDDPVEMLESNLYRALGNNPVVSLDADGLLVVVPGPITKPPIVKPPVLPGAALGYGAAAVSGWYVGYTIGDKTGLHEWLGDKIARWFCDEKGFKVETCRKIKDWIDPETGRRFCVFRCDYTEERVRREEAACDKDLFFRVVPE